MHIVYRPTIRQRRRAMLGCAVYQHCAAPHLWKPFLCAYVPAA